MQKILEHPADSSDVSNTRIVAVCGIILAAFTALAVFSPGTVRWVSEAAQAEYMTVDTAR